MLLECQNCGAPYDVADGATSARCHYCGQSAQVKKFRTMALQTPEGFTPPPTWTPPPGLPAPVRELAYSPYRAARATVKWLGFSTILTLGIGAFVAFRIQSAVQQVTGGASLSSLSDPAQIQNVMNKAFAAVNAAEATAQQAAGSAAALGLPISCSGNDTLTISGKSLSLGAGIPVVASGNCTLHLTQCSVTSITALVVSGNAQAIVEGGTLAGTSGPAVVLSGNATLDVSGGTRLSGEPAVVATSNGTAHITGSFIVGRPLAVQASGNAYIDTAGSTVEGQAVRGRKR